MRKIIDVPFVNLPNLHLLHLPDFLLDVHVKGFDCRHNNLISLKNAPNISDSVYFLCSHNKLTNLIGVSSIFGEKCVFECNNNELTSLEGAPSEVLKFDCGNNELTSLEYAPQTVKFFSCYRNKLKSLTGAPTYVEGDFNCYGNILNNLIGAPTTVGYSFYCLGNPLTSLDGIPKYIGKNLYMPLMIERKFPRKYIRSLSEITGKIYYM